MAEINNLKEIVKVSKILKHKYNVLKQNKNDTETLLQETFKPITNPLQELVKSSKRNHSNNMEIKQENEIKGKYKTRELSLSPTPKKTKRSVRQVLNYDLETPLSNFKQENKDEEEIFESTPTLSPITKAQDALNTPQGQQEMDDLELKFGNVGYEYLLKFLNKDKDLDNVYGLKRDKNGAFKIGRNIINIDKNDIIIDDKEYKGTRGLYELIFKKNPESYTEKDLEEYLKILEQTDAYKNSTNNFVKVSNTSKYFNIIKPYVHNKEDKKQRSSTRKRIKPKKYSHTGSGLLPSNIQFSKNKREYIYWDNPNELVDRLQLLLASKQSGHTGHDNEIISIVEELKEANIIY